MMTGAAGVAGAAVLASGSAAAAPAGVSSPKTRLTADQALAKLRAGNQAFVEDRPAGSDLSRRRRLDIAKGQGPFATLLGCSDSRVGPEQLFGVGLGDLFIVRSAGNNVDTAGLGSIEYSVAELGVPLVVVLGHERCGAVAAAAEVVRSDAALPGNIGRMVEPIIPAVLTAQKTLKSGDDLVEASIRENVRRIARRLRTQAEPILLDPQREGRVKVVGAYYDLDTGEVDFFDLA